MSEPTPGPYQTGRTDMQSYNMDGKPLVNIYREAEDSRTRIHLGEHLPLVIAKCNGDDIPVDELRANARLLAASWEMYVILAEADRDITEIEPDGPEDAEDISDIGRQQWLRIRAVLAKIRG